MWDVDARWKAMTEQTNMEYISSRYSITFICTEIIGIIGRKLKFVLYGLVLGTRWVASHSFGSSD